MTSIAEQEKNNNTNKSSLWGVKFSALAPSSLVDKVISGLDYLLTHFEDGFHFPRNISTKSTNGGQRCVFSKEASLFSYKRANFMDCRISAYPNQKFRRHIKQTPDFLFIDKDDHGSNNEPILKQTLENIKVKFENDRIEPTVLWSGSGGSTS